MPSKEFVKKIGWLDYLKILIYGVVAWLIAFFLTVGSDPEGKISGIASVIFGLTVIYFETLWYRFKNERVKK